MSEAGNKKAPKGDPREADKAEAKASKKAPKKREIAAGTQVAVGEHRAIRTTCRASSSATTMSSVRR